MPRLPPQSARRGLTLLEMVIALLLIALLLSIMVPALSSARMASYRDQSQSNLRRIGQAWNAWLEDHGQTYPFIPIQPGWRYGGVRFSSVENMAIPDYERPLNNYLPLVRTDRPELEIVYCPADRGISDPNVSTGSATRTAYRAYGTSYRANAALFDTRLAGLPEPPAEPRGLRRSEITTAPSRFVVMGEPFWYEVSESTGRTADWYAEPDQGNILFLDGTVRYMAIKPRQIVGPALFDPVMTGREGPAPPQSDPQADSRAVPLAAP